MGIITARTWEVMMDLQEHIDFRITDVLSTRACRIRYQGGCQRLPQAMNTILAC